jgi:hypothetical protein
MLTRILFVLGLALCGIVVLTGAWPGPVATLAPDAGSTFVPKTVPMDPDIVGLGIDAQALLEKALAKLSEDEAAWLNTKIWQTGICGETTFVAEGTLQRGPNQCSRLELDVRVHDMRSHTTIVCDGHSVAHVHKFPDDKAKAEVVKLPGLSEATLAKDRAVREEMLIARGCGSPVVLLRPIHDFMTGATLQTGVLGDVSVVEIKGNIDPTKLPVFAAMNVTTLRAHVYLDAKTLWPRRVEWWGNDKGPHVRQLSVVEFRDPVVGVPLSEGECDEMFSYRPDGNEHVSGHVTEQ